MATLYIDWVLPETRESGRDLEFDEIKHVVIELSADRGQNYAVIGTFTPDVLNTEVPELELGEWFVRGTVVDTSDRASVPLVASIVLIDNSAPSALQSLTLTF